MPIRKEIINILYVLISEYPKYRHIGPGVMEWMNVSTAFPSQGRSCSSSSKHPRHMPVHVCCPPPEEIGIIIESANLYIGKYLPLLLLDCRISVAAPSAALDGIKIREMERRPYPDRSKYPDRMQALCIKGWLCVCTYMHMNSNQDERVADTARQTEGDRRLVKDTQCTSGDYYCCG